MDPEGSSIRWPTKAAASKLKRPRRGVEVPSPSPPRPPRTGELTCAVSAARPGASGAAPGALGRVGASFWRPEMNLLLSLEGWVLW